jgi:hypothetical protein
MRTTFDGESEESQSMDPLEGRVSFYPKAVTAEIPR